MDEFGIIAKYFAPLAGKGAFCLKDDAAVIPARPGFDLVVTTDAVAEGTDFFAADPAEGLAQKALRVNLSDLAAKGAVPFGYLLSLSLPPEVTEEWLGSFAAGLELDQQKYGLSLLGGDTSRGPLAINITAFGHVPEGGMIRRDGASPGDDVYVTGTIGDSAAGLAILRGESNSLSRDKLEALTGRYRLPEPPVAFAVRLRGLASSSVDVSDGLLADVAHLAKASGVKIVIDASAVPRSAAVRALWGDVPGLVRASASGDDYQIAFTAPPKNRDALRAAAEAAGTMVTRIGQAQQGESGVDFVLDGQILPVKIPGYRHF